MTPSKDAMERTGHPTLSKSSINHSPADMSERYTCYLEKQDLYQQLDIKRQCDIIYYYKSERFSTVKETVNDNPTFHLIQPTSDDHLYPLGNRKVLLYGENRLPTLNDITDINHRNRINKKNLLILIYAILRDSMIKNLKGNKMSKKIDDFKVFVKRFGVKLKFGL